MSTRKHKKTIYDKWKIGVTTILADTLTAEHGLLQNN